MDTPQTVFGSCFNERCEISPVLHALHKRSQDICPVRSRVTHGTCLFYMSLIRELGFRSLPKQKRGVHWFSTVAFLPLTLRQRTRRNAIQFARYCLGILSQTAKSGNGRNVHERGDLSMFS